MSTLRTAKRSKKRSDLKLFDVDVEVFYSAHHVNEVLEAADVVVSIIPRLSPGDNVVGIEEFLDLSSGGRRRAVNIADALRQHLHGFYSQEFELDNVRAVYVHRRSNNDLLEEGRLLRLTVLKHYGHVDWLTEFFPVLRYQLTQFFAVGEVRSTLHFQNPTPGSVDETVPSWLMSRCGLEVDEVDPTEEDLEHEAIGQLDALEASLPAVTLAQVRELTLVG